MKAGYRGIGLALLIGLHFVHYVALCPVGEPADSGALWSFAARSGAMLAAPCLLGAWAALGPGRFFDRLPLTVMLAGSLTLAFELGILRNGSMDPAMAFSQAMPVFFVFLAVQIPLWPVRRFLGLRMHSVSSLQESIPADHLQFSIGQLLGWVTGAATLCGFAAYLFSISNPGGTKQWEQIVEELAAVAGFTVLLGVISLATLPYFWLILGEGTWHGPAVAVLLVALGFSTAAMVLNDVFFQDPRKEMLVLVISLQAGLFVSLIVSLLVLRWSGYRLRLQQS